MDFYSISIKKTISSDKYPQIFKLIDDIKYGFKKYTVPIYVVGDKNLVVSNEYFVLASLISGKEIKTKKLKSVKNKLGWGTYEEIKAVISKVEPIKLNDLFLEIKKDLDDKIQTRESLIQKAENIYQEASSSEKKDWKKYDSAFSNIIDSWKKVGFLGKNTDDELWKKLEKNLKKYRKYKSNFFKNRKHAFPENKKTKESLISKSNEILKQVKTEKSNWKNFDKKFQEVFTEWKYTGFVGENDLEQKLWEEFQSVWKSYIKFKEEYFSDLEKHNLENEEEKKTLISEIKEFKKQVQNQESKLDPFEKVNKLKTYFSKWKNIGPSRSSKRKKIWQEFKQTHDEIYEIASDEIEELKKQRKFSKIQSHIEEIETERKTLQEELENLYEKIDQESAGANSYGVELRYDEQINSLIEKIKQKDSKIEELKNKTKN